MSNQPEIEGAYFYLRDDGYHLAIVSGGKTIEYRLQKGRIYAILSSALEAMKRDETGVGFTGF